MPNAIIKVCGEEIDLETLSLVRLYSLRESIQRTHRLTFNRIGQTESYLRIDERYDALEAHVGEWITLREQETDGQAVDLDVLEAVA